MSPNRYIVVQHTGFMPYFLYAWKEGLPGGTHHTVWNCLRTLALKFDGNTARKVMKLLNAQTPTALLPVSIMVIR